MSAITMLPNRCPGTRIHMSVGTHERRERPNDLVAPAAYCDRHSVVWLRGGRQDTRTGYAEVIDIICCLNPAKQVLISNHAESQIRLVVGSVFHRDWIHKHTGAIVIASDHQYV